MGSSLRVVAFLRVFPRLVRWGARRGIVLMLRRPLNLAAGVLGGACGLLAPHWIFYAEHVVRLAPRREAPRRRTRCSSVRGRRRGRKALPAAARLPAAA